MRVQERVQGRVGALRQPPKAFGAARRSSRASKLVIVICLVAVAARLILINQPYVDHWSWRQSDVAAIARNFLQNGFHFGYPQIDWAGNAPGYVGTEFPILPFIAALCYTFAGVHECIGRAQAVILFAVSLPFFFLLVREVFGSTAAVWATFFYGFAPVNIFAGRSFMPDVPSLSLAIIGLYFFLRWMEDRKPGLFLAAATAISLCLLIKITNIILLAPLAYLVVAAVSDRRQNGAQRAPLTVARSLLRDRARAVWHLVLARSRDREQILSASLLRRRWDPSREVFVVLAYCAADSGIGSHAGSFPHGVARFVRPAAAGSKISPTFFLVAGCDGPLYHCGWLRQPASLVSTSSGTDCRLIRGRGLRVRRVKNFLACCRGHIVDSAGQFIHDLCLLVTCDHFICHRHSFSMPVWN